MGSINTQKPVSAAARVGNECLWHTPPFAEVCLAVALAKVPTSACEKQLLFIGHSPLPPNAGYRSNKEVGTTPLFTISFCMSLQQQLMGRDTSDVRWESASLTQRPAVIILCHRDILNITRAWMLDPEVLKDHKYHAGRFGGLFGCLFQVGEGFSSYRRNRTMMFPGAVEFATHFSWMDTWFQGPSAAFSKADARNISPAEKQVGVSTQPAVVKSQDVAQVQPLAAVACLAAVQQPRCVLSQRTGGFQPFWETKAWPWAPEHSPNQDGTVLHCRSPAFVHQERRISKKKFQAVRYFSELS